MTFDTNIKNLATRMSSQDKLLLTLLSGNVANLNALTTTDKTNLVAAVNELMTRLAGLISDTAASTTKTYSSSKVDSQISSATAAVKAEILGGAGAAFDTLQELRDLLTSSDQADDDAIAAINTALGNRLRVDVAQTLTDAQKLQGRDNLSVYSKAEIGDVTTNYVAIYEAGL